MLASLFRRVSQPEPRFKQDSAMVGAELEHWKPLQPWSRRPVALGAHACVERGGLVK